MMPSHVGIMTRSKIRRIQREYKEFVYMSGFSISVEQFINDYFNEVSSEVLIDLIAGSSEDTDEQSTED